MMRRRVVGVVPAAGRGTRFAEADPAAPPKMLAHVDGVPMVRRSVESLLGGGVEHCVVVVSTSSADGVGHALRGLPVTLVVNPDPSRGMFSSIQCGTASTATSDVCVFLPGDMPYVQTSTISLVIAAARDADSTVTPSLNGHRGHPVVCSSALRGHILAAAADTRLDHLMQLEDVVEIPIDDVGVRHDIDRPFV